MQTAEGSGFQRFGFPLAAEEGGGVERRRATASASRDGAGHGSRPGSGGERARHAPSSLTMMWSKHLDAFERGLLRAALERTAGNKSAAARLWELPAAGSIRASKASTSPQRLRTAGRARGSREVHQRSNQSLGTFASLRARTGPASRTSSSFARTGRRVIDMWFSPALGLDFDLLCVLTCSSSRASACS